MGCTSSSPHPSVVKFSDSDSQETREEAKPPASPAPALTTLTRDLLPQHIQTNVDILQNLSRDEVDRICAVMQLESFAPCSTIVSQGGVPDKFFIMSKGVVDLVKSREGEAQTDGKVVSQLDSPSHFCDSVLLATGGSNISVRKCSIVVPKVKKGAPSSKKDRKKGYVDCFTITADAFATALLPSKVAEVMARSDPPDVEAEKRVAEHAIRHAHIPKSELTTIGLLGTGSSGRVFLVAKSSGDTDDNGDDHSCSSSKKYFAKKVLDKSDVEESAKERAIEREIRLLKCVDHPFIVKLFSEYDSPTEVSLLLEFVQGGELFALIHPDSGATHGVSSSDAHFYAAVIQRALAHIHARDIVFRDIKPENILVDARGYPKIIDFGLSKKLRAEDTTFTMCGTVEYVAPECLGGRGYRREVDWWGFGILLYEMIAGRTPFHAPSDQEVYHKILNGKIRFLRKFEQEEKAFLRKLLVADPSRRLKDAEAIKSNACLQFYGIEELESFSVEAPWIPHVADSQKFRYYGNSPQKLDVTMPPMLSPTRM